MRLYIPFTIFSKDLPPRIVYPARDEGRLDRVFKRTDPRALHCHLEQLYKQHQEIRTGSYHVVVIWSLKGVAMTDVWIMSMDNYYALSGPFVICKTFAGMKPSADTGLASGDTLLMLGAEEELRRYLHRPIKEYANRAKYLPNLPATVMCMEAFEKGTL